jgi:peptidoglycan/LPS O-acetylase OafA/YrhL
MRAGVRTRFLDELRGLAILAVLLRHAWPDSIPLAGILGVVTFFTLSGFLISSILIEEFRVSSGISMKWFYAKRAIRLVPALIVFLAFWSLFKIFVLHDSTTVGRSVLIALAYIGDFPLGLDPSIGHLWTLSTEEQFYLLWPLLLLLALRKGRVGLVLITTAVLFEVTKAITIASVHPIRGIYILPSSWAICLLAGAAAAYYSNRIVGSKRSFKYLPWGFIAAFFLLWFVPMTKESPLLYLVVAPGWALFTAVAITIMTNQNFDTFHIPGARKLGQISYAAYLWNYPISMLAVEISGPYWGGAVAIISTLLMATISWWLVERPASTRLKAWAGSRLGNPA